MGTYLQLVAGDGLHQQAAGVRRGRELHAGRTGGDQSPAGRDGREGDDDLGLGEGVAEALAVAAAERDERAAGQTGGELRRPAVGVETLWGGEVALVVVQGVRADDHLGASGKGDVAQLYL